MPAYNFKKEFVPKILAGSKPHTIRKRRKNPTKVGDVIMLYTGQRTKQCKLIALSECVKVEQIVIYSDQRVMVNDATLSYVQIKELAERDGFEDVQDFFKFFEDHYALPISDFEIIWWSVEHLMKHGNGNGKYGKWKLLDQVQNET